MIRNNERISYLSEPLWETRHFSNLSALPGTRGEVQSNDFVRSGVGDTDGDQVPFDLKLPYIRDMASAASRAALPSIGISQNLAEHERDGWEDCEVANTVPMLMYGDFGDRRHVRFSTE